MAEAIIYNEVLTVSTTDTLTFSFTNLPFTPNYIMMFMAEEFPYTPSQNTLFTFYAERATKGFKYSYKNTSQQQPLYALNVGSLTAEWGADYFKVPTLETSSYGKVYVPANKKFRVIIWQ